jgi:hypothetical protein
MPVEDGGVLGDYMVKAVDEELARRAEGQRHQPVVSVGRPEAKGDFDKNVLRRYVRQRLPQITTCYGDRLVDKPDLAGTLTATFTIAADGVVIASKASGIGDETLESCVADAIRSIQFPRSKGGGIVSVTLPLTLAPPAPE